MKRKIDYKTGVLIVGGALLLLALLSFVTNGAAGKTASQFSEGNSEQGEYISEIDGTNDITKEIDTKLYSAKLIDVLEPTKLKVEHDSEELIVNLIGLKGASVSNVYGRDAVNEIKKYLSDKTIYLEFTKTRLTKNGESLAYVWITNKIATKDTLETSCLNAYLVANGYCTEENTMIDENTRVESTHNFSSYKSLAVREAKGYWLYKDFCEMMGEDSRYAKYDGITTKKLIKKEEENTETTTESTESTETTTEKESEELEDFPDAAG